MAQLPHGPAALNVQFHPTALLPVETSDFDPSTFPKSHHLIVTTTKGVYSWSRNGITELFRSGSEGIVAAKRAGDGSGVLAVADSQVVILHDVKRGMDKSYRLKGSDGQVCLLRYANDSRSLFFTTSLQNSVQAYSSRQSRLLDPFHTHPSPPNILALSPTSHLLLSASATPPTIHLANLTLRTPPILLRPSCSSTPVVAASFHPERANVFLLAFADGALAVYDAGHLFQNAGKGERRSGPAGTGKGGEIGHVRGLHAAGATSIPSDSIALLNAAALGGYDEGTKTVSVGSRSSGVTAIAFIPGYRARAISAGADGKCYVVDFDGSNKKKGRIVKSWHVRGPATSLSVVPLNGDLSLGQLDRPGTTGSERNPAIAIRERLIAVGRLDGKVCFFDNSGTLMGEKTVDSAGGRIVDVEWMDGSGDQLSKTHSGVLSSPAKSSDSAAMSTRTVKAKRESVARSKRKSLGSILAAGRQVEEELVTVAYEDNEGAESVTLAPAVEMSGALLEPSLHSSQGSPSPTVWQDVMEPYTANYMDLFSPVKQKESQRNSNYVAASPRKRKSASGRKGLPGGAVSNSQSSVSPSQPDFSKALRRESRSSIRPRPIPCQGAQMSMRRAHTARRASQDDGKVIAGIRRATVPGKPAKGFALFAPYMQRKVMKDGNEAVGISPSTAHAIAAQRPETSSQADEDVWAEVTGGPTIPPRRRSQKSATTASRKSRKTVSFQPSSTTEASDDTIIDWQNGQPQPTPPVSGPPQIFSQARNSNSYGRETTTSNDTVVQRFSSKKSPPEFQVHQDHPGRFRTSPSPHVRSATAQVETPKATPLIETSHNLTCATSSPLKSETSNKSKQHTGSRCDSHVLEEKLEEAKRSLRDEMRSFQTEMLKQFQAHQKRMEDALSKESSERQRVAEENRLLREELSKERRRKC